MWNKVTGVDKSPNDPISNIKSCGCVTFLPACFVYLILFSQYHAKHCIRLKGTPYLLEISKKKCIAVLKIYICLRYQNVTISIAPKIKGKISAGHWHSATKSKMWLLENYLPAATLWLLFQRRRIILKKSKIFLQVINGCTFAVRKIIIYLFGLFNFR